MKEIVESSNGVVVFDDVKTRHGAHDSVHVACLAVPVVRGKGGSRCSLEANGEFEISDVMG